MPPTNAQSRRAIRRAILGHLASEDFSSALDAIRQLPRSKTINALIGCLSRPDEKTKRRAIEAIGAMVSDLAADDLPAAREVVRRLIWSLTEESGNIGWGAPEAIGEIAARHEGLAREYAHLLVTFITDGPHYLRHEPLMRGVAWAIGRVAEARPDLMRATDAAHQLEPLLESTDAPLRELARRAIACLDAGARERRSPDRHAV